MKRWCMMAVVLMPVLGRAQFLGGIFNQGSTELKDYALQLATLGLLDGQINKGNGSEHGGLVGIDQTTIAEWALHQNYITALGQVSPSVRGMPECAETVRICQATVGLLQNSLDRWGQAGGLSMDEWGMLYELRDAIDGQCDRLLQALLLLLTDGSLSLSDDQRMGMVRGLDKQAQEEYGWVVQLVDQVEVTLALRWKERAEGGSVWGWYGLP